MFGAGLVSGQQKRGFPLVRMRLALAAAAIAIANMKVMKSKRLAALQGIESGQAGLWRYAKVNAQPQA